LAAALAILAVEEPAKEEILRALATCKSACCARDGATGGPPIAV
jgi:hypothetical protein